MFAASKTNSASTGGYQISRSLRFNSADSAYLNRTPASAGNRKTWTYSTWVKLSNLTSSIVTILEQNTANTDAGFLAVEIVTDAQSNNIVIEGYNTVFRRTTASYRDYSAWYHIVVAVDTTQATANNRIRLYINGVEVTAFGTTNNPTQNADTGVNSTGIGYIGLEAVGVKYSNAYMTEIYMVDGSQLTPSSFGETNAQTGVWQPKAYSGSYGTNGFYLNFSDNSNTTAATLGKDYSGNGNNWTPNNFSVTAGAGNDSLVDSPTSYGTDTGVGGTVRGNYGTWNSNVAKNTNALIYANGNLQVTGAGAGNGGSGISTMAMTTGKWYAEFVFTSGTLQNDMGFGIVNSLWNIGLFADDYFWKTSYGYQYGVNAAKENNAIGTSYGATYTINDIIGVAFDADAGTLTFYKNGVSQGVAFSSIPSGSYLFATYIFGGTSPVAYGNFGQRPFAYTAPSGFKALCTQNLPTPTIGATTATQAGKYFNPVLYTGTGATNAITVGFQPDFLWFKTRSTATSHALYNSITGVTKFLTSNATDAESTSLANTDLISIDSNGFTVGTQDHQRTNESGRTYVAWNWKANGTGSTNTAGQITSTVSASTTSGFSIVTFTADGTTKTVGHGLGVKPSLVIVKVRNAVGSWIAMTDIINGSMQYGTLNSTAAFASIGYSAPTSTVFQYNDNNGNTQVAYCFAPIAGYSAFGSYTGNGSTDGPFVYTGFRPAYVMVKPSSAAGSWWINDNKRDTYNVNDHRINANTSDAEATAGFTQQDFLSNGFKWRNSDSAWNGSGVTYIYMAFAENPFKYSLAR